MKNSLRKSKDSGGPMSDGRQDGPGKCARSLDCYFDVDERMIIRYWSAGMENFTHKYAPEVVGSEVSDVMPLLAGRIESVLKSGRKRRIKDFKNECLRGSVSSGQISLEPHRNEAGEVKGVHVKFSGLNGSCPMEQKLVESEKMVAIGKMASSLAHGVRNPLNAIKGAVVYLKDKYAKEPTLLEFCSIITEEIEKLDSFISDFLSASKKGMTLSTVNVNGILETIITMIRPRAKIQGIKIVPRFSVLPLISADSFQIEQALFNVINNAMEAMSGGGRLTLRTSMKWENGQDYVMVQIRDTGGGIPGGKMSGIGRLTDGGERSDRGFGVFLAREVIKSHNGRLHWESVPDRGTTFNIYLPVKHHE